MNLSVNNMKGPLNVDQWAFTCKQRPGLCLHLQSDLDEVDRRPQAHGHKAGQHTGHSQVQHVRGVPAIAIAILAYDSLCVAEEAEDY